MFIKRIFRWLQERSDLQIAFGIFGISLVTQMFFIGSYGASWDEPLHRNWAQMSFLALRQWNPQILELMPGNGMHYGTIVFIGNYLLSLFGIAVGLPMVAANHIGIVLAASIGLGSAYLLGTVYGGRRTGFLTTFFCIFYIPFLEHAQFNPKDVPLMAAVTLASCIFLRARQYRSARLTLFAAALIGMMVSVKIIAIFMLPAIFVSYIHSILPLREKKIHLRSEALFICTCVIISAFTCFLLWPTAWIRPSLIPNAFVFFLTKNFWQGSVLFFGNLYAGTELPWYYTLFELFSSMPLLMILCVMIGFLVLSFSSAGRKIASRDVFLFFWILAPLFIASAPSMTHYDGMRQYFFVLPAIAILASRGAEFVLDAFGDWRLFSRLTFGSVVLGALLSSFAYEALLFHPHQASYRNEIMRLVYGNEMHKHHEMELYGSSLKAGVAWLNKNAEKNSIVCVPTAGFLLEWYDVREDISLDCTSENDYVMAIARNRNAHLIVPSGSEPVFRLQRAEADLLSIYRT